MIKCAGRIGIWSVGFCGGRKTGEPGENPRPRDENQQQIQSTRDARSGNRTRATRATAVGGECSHHHTIPAALDPEVENQYKISKVEHF